MPTGGADCRGTGMHERSEPSHSDEQDPLLCRVDLPLRTGVYPLGFPALVETNSPEVLQHVTESWRRFTPHFKEAEVHLNVVVSDSPARGELPPPVFRCRRHLLSVVCGPHNSSVCDLNAGYACAFITSEAAQAGDYLRDTFTDAMLLTMLHSRHLAVVHAACVVLDGEGVLLCGESGAGKSSLALGCALRGWTLVCDDASFLIRKLGGRTVTGNPYLMRFKPDAGSLFPGLAGRAVVARTNGKSAIQVETSEFPQIVTAERAEIRYTILLRRSDTADAQLVRCEADRFRHLRFPPYGDPSVIAEQEKTLQALSGIEAFELRYGDLDAAVQRLTDLVRGGATG